MTQLTNINIKILQWNSRSIVANKASLLDYLKDNPVDVIVLSETWLKPDTKIYINGFHLVHEYRNDGKGGVGIFISRTISFSKININKNFNNQIEICAVTLDRYNISIVSVYKPPTINATKADWQNIFLQFQNETVVCGDFNAHHCLWGSLQNCNQGLRLVEAIDNTDLINLNDGSPTRISPPSQVPSKVDLTFTTPNLASRCTWRVNKDPMGSDHFPILIDFSIWGTTEKINPTTKWKENYADWYTFQTYLETYLNCLPGDKIDFSVLANAISNAATASMPIKKPCLPFTSRPIWWNEECSQIIVNRKVALNKYKTVSNLENYLKYKQEEARAKRVFKQAYRQCWKEFLSKLNKNTPQTVIWQFIKKIANKNSYFNKHTISVELIEEIFNHITPPTLAKLPFPNVCTDSTVVNNTIDRPFNKTELDHAIKLTKSTAPGLDNFTYNIIKNLPAIAKTLLLKIYNDFWLEGKYISQFKEIVICLILKPNKDKNFPTSYRPISLMSCFLKIFERMIKLRLEWFLEYNQLLPKCQYGFRRGYGTIDAATQLVTNIQLAFSKNKYLACIFLDLKGAYDAVELNILGNKLIEIGLSKNASTNLVEMYSDRKIFIRDHNNNLHGPRYISQGIPQGSVLSPLLFNVYTAKMHDIAGDSIHSLQFADDFVFYTIADSYEECVGTLKQIMFILKTQINDLGFTISTEKSAVMVFTRHRLHSPDNINLCGYNIPIVSEYKYLGLVLDTKLLWTKHIHYVKAKCEKGVNMLRCISRSKWGADPKISLLFYRSYIRSILDYGCILYGSASNTNLLSIDRIQYKSIRICIGAMGSSPCHAILAEAQEAPLKLRRKLLAKKYVLKIRTLKSNYLLKCLCVVSIENYTNKYWRIKNTPPLVEAFSETGKYDDCLITSEKSHPIFNIEYDDIIHSPCIIYPIYSDITRINVNIMKSILSNYSDDYIIYTDGSKNDKGTGSAFYVPNTNHSFMRRIHNMCSIFTAEAFAIESALKWITDNNVGDSVIISDSKAVLQSLKASNLFKNYQHPIICNIKKLVCNLYKNNQKVTFIWTKGHSGIVGNEIVDRLAKESVTLPAIYNILMIPDIICSIKKDIRMEWEEMWANYVQESTNPYTLIHPTLPNSIPHISEYPVSRFYSTTITRLKLNHGRFPAHLCKVGVLTSSLCVCDNTSVADVNHLIFACKNHTHEIKKFMNKLNNFKIQQPLNIVTLLSSQKKYILDEIINLIKASNIII